MHLVIHFESRLFDISDEPENSINPIRGISLLLWLRSRVHAHLNMSAPEPEDWGWYSNVEWQGRNYMISACAHESPDGNHEWILQIEKSRSFKERLLGKEKLSPEDPCYSYIYTLVAEEPSFTEIAAVCGP